MERVKTVYVDFVKSISFVVPANASIKEIYDLAYEEGQYYTYDTIEIKAVGEGRDDYVEEDE